MGFAEVTPDTSVAAAVRVMRKRARNSINSLYSNLKDIAALATTHGTTAVAAQLNAENPGDAAAFADFYDNGRLVLVAHSQSPTLDTDIPLRATLPA